MLKNRKIIVLDDDPTGIQTVHDVPVYTDWDEDTIRQAMLDDIPLFFILTNSRSFSEKKTKQVHKEIADRVADAASSCGKKFLIVSRGDSTLRGHFPLETETIKDAISEKTGLEYSGEIIVPCFPEGGRITKNDIHYVRMKDGLVPAGETEFAKDATFGYKSSDLKEYCEEKTGGRYPASCIISISLDDLRNKDIRPVYNKLMSVTGFNKIIVNSETYEDLAVFTDAFEKAVNDGKEYILRGAAAIVKTLGHISDRPLLSRKDLVKEGNKNGGLIIVGSHVKKTTEQLEYLLKKIPELQVFCLDAGTVFEENFNEEADKIRLGCEEAIASGKTALVYTSRKVIGTDSSNKEHALSVSTSISDALTEIVKGISVRPSFILAKGGITSSDIGVKALAVRKAIVKGQVAPGIPVWDTGNSPYIIFPGNVGTETTLYDVVHQLI